jgi:hypothetical protein
MPIRVIPGVDVRVLKEIVPPLPSPSGVLGLIGVVEKLGDDKEGNPIEPTVENLQNWRLTPVSSFKSLVEIFGAATSFSIPEAKQAFQNGIFELVLSPVPGGNKASLPLNDEHGDPVATLEAKAAGPWANDISVMVERRNATAVDITIGYGSVKEIFKGLNLEPSSPENPKNLFDVINDEARGSILVRAIDEDISTNLPVSLDESPMNGGVSPTTSDYNSALQRLEEDPGIDMVMGSFQVYNDPNLNVDEVHSAIEAHCQNQSNDAQNRIGLGTINLEINNDAATIVQKAQALNSDRFVLVAPHGVTGAVAGLIGGLTYYESPTFKRLSGVAKLEYEYSPSQLRTLLESYVLPVSKKRERGIIVTKGIATDSSQISVTRVADHAVREVKKLAELFIGTLNTEDGRLSLKQKITELFQQMEKENAIVPSTDEPPEPAFKVDVYSSPRDFAQGIVRVDIAVRPVRAIDFIYATILVEV